MQKISSNAVNGDLQDRNDGYITGKDVKGRQEDAGYKGQDRDNPKRSDPKISRKNVRLNRVKINPDHDGIADEKQRIRETRHHPFSERAFN